jgi:hypothetical protein
MNFKKHLLLLMLYCFSSKAFSTEKQRNQIVLAATFELLTEELKKTLGNLKIDNRSSSKKARKNFLGKNKAPFTTRAAVEEYLGSIGHQSISKIKDNPWGKSQKEFFKILLLCCKTKKAREYLFLKSGLTIKSLDLLLPHETSVVAFNLGLTEDSGRKNSEETNKLKVIIRNSLNE